MPRGLMSAVAESHHRLPVGMVEIARFVPTSSTMKSMVALLDKSPLPSKTALRARGATSSFNSRRATAVKSSNYIEIRRFTYDARRRLGLCSNEGSGYLGGGNPFAYSGNAPLFIVDPSGQSPADPIIARQCGRVLLATIAGWRALGNNCAADLMAASLRKNPNPCPDSCRDALKREGFGFVSHCLRGRLAYQAECGKASRQKFDLSGNHYYQPGDAKAIDPASDLAFGFGHFVWRAVGECESTCAVPKNGCCCDCSVQCGFEITTGPDDYDFKPDPAAGETFPHPLWCIDYMQKHGEAKIFPVQCRVTAYGVNAGKFSRCPGPPLPDTRPCPGTVSGPGRPVELE